MADIKTAAVPVDAQSMGTRRQPALVDLAPQRYTTIASVARHYGVSVDMVRDAVVRGEFPGARKVSNRYRIPLESAERWGELPRPDSAVARDEPALAPARPRGGILADLLSEE